MKLLFKDPQFRAGLNVTVRNGSKWLLPPGTPLEIFETGRETAEQQLFSGQIVHAVEIDFDAIPQTWLDREHTPAARTHPGLHAAMDRAYGVDQWGPRVTVVLFELDLSIPDQVIMNLHQERQYQLMKGRAGKLPGPDEGWTFDFDDKNTVSEWTGYVGDYLSDARRTGKPEETKRPALVKAATTAVAAIEAYDRNGSFPRRHFDP